MKKAKIMLTSLAVVLVVAGALAFKSQATFGGTKFCVGTFNNLNTAVPTYSSDHAFGDAPALTYIWRTTDASGALIDAEEDCQGLTTSSTNSARITGED